MKRSTLPLLALLLGCTACSSSSRSDGKDEDTDTGTDADTDSDTDIDTDTDSDTGSDSSTDTTTGSDDSCDDSPVVGDWEGTFEGDVTTSVTGPTTVWGVMTFEIVCEDKLILSGEMIGELESPDTETLPFEATITGEYDEAENQIEAEIEGTIVLVTFTGTGDGSVVDWDPVQAEGTWEGEAPLVDGVGNGTWEAAII
jgi:hypothetical protein